MIFDKYIGTLLTTYPKDRVTNLTHYVLEVIKGMTITDYRSFSAWSTQKNEGVSKSAVKGHLPWSFAHDRENKREEVVRWTSFLWLWKLVWLKGQITIWRFFFIFGWSMAVYLHFVPCKCHGWNRSKKDKIWYFSHLRRMLKKHLIRHTITITCTNE